MTAVNQLLAKARSTSSEEEAISCLRMARKKGNSFSSEKESQSQDFKGQNAKYWYDKANFYYQEAKKREDTGGLSLGQQKMLLNMYNSAEEEKRNLAIKVRKLENDNVNLKKKSGQLPGFIYGIFVASILAVFAVVFL